MDSTPRAYKSGQNRFVDFCRQANYKAVPASDTVLCHVISYLAEQKLKDKTIKVYLSGICFRHISEEEGDPFHPSLDRLQYILCAIKRVEAYSRTERIARETPGLPYYSEEGKSSLGGFRIRPKHCHVVGCLLFIIV